MFPIIQVSKEMKDSDIPQENCYLIGSNGVFKQVVNEFYSVRVKNGSLPDLQELKEDVELHVTRLPQRILDHVHAFFRAVNDKHKGEAVVLLMYHPTDKRWIVKIPPQDTKGMSVHYDLDKGDALIWIPSNGKEEMTLVHNQREAPPEGIKDFRLFGSIHSHCDAGAFHSGTDDKDEFCFDGLHITLGHVSKNPPDISCRWMLAGQWWKAEASGCIAFDHAAPKVDDRWMDRVSEVKYSPAVQTWVSPPSGTGFDSPMSRHPYDGNGYGYSGYEGPGSHDDPKSQTPTQAGGGSAGGSTSGTTNPATSSTNTPDVGEDDTPPVYELFARYEDVTEHATLTSKELSIIQLCEDDPQLLSFMETLSEEELKRLLTTHELFDKFMEEASIDFIARKQAEGDGSGKTDIDGKRLADLIEEEKEAQKEGEVLGSV
jgi:hypothetical protein